MTIPAQNSFSPGIFAGRSNPFRLNSDKFQQNRSVCDVSQTLSFKFTTPDINNFLIERGLIIRIRCRCRKQKIGPWEKSAYFPSLFTSGYFLCWRFAVGGGVCGAFASTGLNVPKAAAWLRHPKASPPFLKEVDRNAHPGKANPCAYSPIRKQAISFPLRTISFPSAIAGTFQVLPSRAGNRAISRCLSGVA